MKILDQGIVRVVEQPNGVKQILGATSFNNAYVVDDYPYGFTQRTKKAYYVEYKAGKGKGYRRVEVTLNPKTGQWNAPKKGVYKTALVMYLDDKGYVQYAGVTPYSDTEALKAFAEKYYLQAYQQEDIAYIVKARGIIAEVLAKRQKELAQ